MNTMTFDEARLRLENGCSIKRRDCRICKGPILIKLRAAVGKILAHPVLVSCKCRPKGGDNVIDYSWEDLRLLF